MNNHMQWLSSDRTNAVSRRIFLEGIGMGAVSSFALSAAAKTVSAANAKPGQDSPLPAGKALKIKPVLVYHLEEPRELTSWRSYGAIHTKADVEAEANHIAEDLKTFSVKSEFPIEIQPVTLAANEHEAKAITAGDMDAILIYAAGGWTPIYEALSATSIPCVMYVRHKTKPHYLWYEIAHWRFLRRNEDAMVQPNMDTGDIVVDDYDEILWRMRAIYGLKNAKGTKMLAIGSLAAYSEPAQELGPTHARDVWNYDIEIVPREEYAQRLQKAREDRAVVEAVEKETDAFLKRPGVTLQTDRKFVYNSFMAYWVCKDLLQEKNAFNFGFDFCMGREIIEMLDTPPCLVLALANDEGYSAYCHTDLSHTCAGVFMRRLTQQPTFLCNTHFPHDGIFTVAHCSAPRRMNGRDYEPVTIMTHYESDYGAASKVEYTKGQQVTVVIPNLHCTKWQGFKGRIVATPSLPACRSQMDIQVDGDMDELIKEMEGFHCHVVYGDFLRETGYALKKLGKIGWRNFSAVS